MLTIEKNNKLKEEHFKNVKTHIQNTIQRILDDGGLKKKNSSGKMVLTSRLSPNDIVFLKLIKQDDKLNEIVSIKPERMRGSIRWSKIKYHEIHDKTTVLYECVYNIFVTNGYEKSKNINKYEFIKSIGLESCPYCNRSYIYTIGKNKKIKPEIDHFYPKDLYPILALSYYNLIPSCPTCNGLGAKSNQDTCLLKLKNPYLIDSDDFKFNFKIKSLSILNPLNNIDKDSIDICFDKEIANHSTVFGLDELYKEHRDVVLELYIKANHEYVKKYVEYLHSYKGLIFADDEIYRLITCGYKNENDLHKRPLSKLIKDISEELGLL